MWIGNTRIIMVESSPTIVLDDSKRTVWVERTIVLDDSKRIIMVESSRTIVLDESTWTARAHWRSDEWAEFGLFRPGSVEIKVKCIIRIDKNLPYYTLIGLRNRLFISQDILWNLWKIRKYKKTSYATVNSMRSWAEKVK